MESNSTITPEEIRSKALTLGWDDVGITQAKIPEEDITAYKEWLTAECHADLKYMENQIRCTPDAILKGAKSAIIFVSYYKQEKAPFRQDAGVVASYARGRDYHNVHRRRLKRFIHWLEERAGKKGIARGFSDSKPVLEKALAVQAGLGWFGKNTLLIHRKFGTFTLLSGLFTTLELPYPAKTLRMPRCGVCTRCLDACPTQALVKPYLLDAEKCLSYHLIESKAPLPKEIQEKNPGYLFGCDICQDVCPHNVRPLPVDSEDFSPDRGVGPYLSLEKLLTLEKNPELLHGTPLKRKGIPGLKVNAGEILLNEYP